ncbi:unnamed protein product [Prunus armeniaca]
MALALFVKEEGWVDLSDTNSGSRVFLFAAIFLIYLLLFGLNMHFAAKLEGSGTSIRISAWQEIFAISCCWKTTQMQAFAYAYEDVMSLSFLFVGLYRDTKFSLSLWLIPYNDFPDLPCEVGFLESVEYLVEPKEVMNFTLFSLEFIDQEEEGIPSRRPPGFSSTGFDIDAKDKAYKNECKIAVSSCIFGSSDFLRRPTSKKDCERRALLKLFWHREEPSPPGPPPPVT